MGLSFLMEASGCPVLCKEDHGCLCLSWDTSCVKLADNPAALLQASASGQTSCILFSSLYPCLPEQTKTRDPTPGWWVSLKVTEAGKASGNGQPLSQGLV